MVYFSPFWGVSDVAMLKMKASVLFLFALVLQAEAFVPRSFFTSTSHHR